MRTKNGTFLCFPGITLRILGMSWGVKTTCFEAPGMSLGGSGVSIGGVKIVRVLGKYSLQTKRPKPRASFTVNPQVSPTARITASKVWVVPVGSHGKDWVGNMAPNLKMYIFTIENGDLFFQWYLWKFMVLSNSPWKFPWLGICFWNPASFLGPELLGLFSGAFTRC